MKNLWGNESDRDRVVEMSQADRIDRAIALLRQYEPADGYYLAFSGGKDSCVIKELAKMSGVKFDAWYNNTTIDPPELVRFIKEHHADVKWNQPDMAMMRKVEEWGLPTRFNRWCCSEYKEQGGAGRVCIFGVRAAESMKRAMRWVEWMPEIPVNRAVVCAVVFWSDENIWEFIRSQSIPYCKLYDEGFARLGCVGCPLSDKARREGFVRWPKYEANWKNAARRYYDTHKGTPTKRGKVRFTDQFPTFEDFWHWWMTDDRPDILREECQSGQLWTNQELDEIK
jgi:phosphoadenosine phosphosulfate reductase